jgi:hypothetical protein
VGDLLECRVSRTMTMLIVDGLESDVYDENALPALPVRTRS